MATIKFRTKIQTVHNHDGTVAWRDIKVPELKRSHCDMAAFRRHPKFGSYANSDLFPNLLSRIRKDIANCYGEMRLDRLPANVTVDESGFLALVTIEV